jgi:hypothetical protein
MASLLCKIIDNTVTADEANVQSFNKSIYIAGDDSATTITSPGVPTLNIVPDPEVKLGPSFYIVDDGYDAIEHFVDAINEDNTIKAKIGRKAIEGVVIAVVRKYKDTSNPQQKALQIESRSMMASLHALIEETEATVPVENLVLVGLTELVVGKVKFVPSSTALPAMQQKLAQSLGSNTDADKQAKISILEDTAVAHYRNSPTCAELTLDAEHNRVTELVDSEVDASLNLLRCYTHLFFPKDARAFIGLKGVISESTRPCVDFTANGFHINLQKVGMFFPYTVTPDVLEEMVKHYAFNELSDVLKKEEADRTGLERVIVTAIRWLGRSVNATDLPEQVLSLAIALERLMIPDNEQGGKADSLALRLAFLVGENEDSRRIIYDQGKKLYRLRSDVVHDGRIQLPTADIEKLEGYSCLALIKMAQNLKDWKTHNDFVYWAKKRTLQ